MEIPSSQSSRQRVAAGSAGPQGGEPVRRIAWPWRVAGMLALALVLGLAFLGHLSPEMKLQWENLMALCGF